MTQEVGSLPLRQTGTEFQAPGCGFTQSCLLQSFEERTRKIEDTPYIRLSVFLSVFLAFE